MTMQDLFIIATNQLETAYRTLPKSNAHKMNVLLTKVDIYDGFISFFVITANCCLAQLPQNLSKSDSIRIENFNYIVAAPATNQTKGVVVLLPGLFDPPLSIFFESDLPLALNKLNYSIIIPVLSQKGDRFDLSDKSLDQLGKLITQYIQTSNLRQEVPIILGGFSIGGTRVLKACTSKDNPLGRLKISHDSIQAHF